MVHHSKTGRLKCPVFEWSDFGSPLYFKNINLQERNTDLDLSIENTARVVQNEKFTYNLHSFRSAQLYYEMLHKLLGSNPSYSNFFCKFIHPLHSKLIRQLTSVRTTNERLAMFKPLLKFVTKGLADQRDELVNTVVARNSNVLGFQMVEGIWFMVPTIQNQNEKMCG